MGLFDRVNRLVRSNLNSLINRAEDPQKGLEQAIRTMQVNLMQLRQAVAQAIATQKRSERQLAQSQSLAAEWQRQAQQVLQQGDEVAAREALVRRRSYAEAAATIKAQLGQQSSAITKLKQSMAGLECKIAEAQTRRDLFLTRTRAAQASQQLYEIYSRVNTRSPFNAFDLMEERVQQLEAQAETMAELSRDDLAAQFAALESRSDVDSPAAMKEQRVGKPQGRLPQGFN